MPSVFSVSAVRRSFERLTNGSAISRTRPSTGSTNAVARGKVAAGARGTSSVEGDRPRRDPAEVMATAGATAIMPSVERVSSASLWAFVAAASAPPRASASPRAPREASDRGCGLTRAVVSAALPSSGPRPSAADPPPSLAPAVSARSSARPFSLPPSAVVIAARIGAAGAPPTPASASLPAPSSSSLAFREAESSR